MDASPPGIRVLSDARPGHENQSLGLAEAIARRAPVKVETVRFGAGDFLWDRLHKALAGARGVKLFVGAGHRTHLTLSLAARRLGVRSVVIMSPTWPLRFFDLCLAPEHDLPPGRRRQSRVISTLGALNRIPERLPPKQATGVVLIGGPSKNHGWAAQPLLESVANVLRARPDLAWVISDSRRTPAGFLAQLRRLELKAEILSHEQTPPSWVPEQLAAAEEVWVSEDSVSMIFEAVTAAARTGVLPAPVKKQNAGPLLALRRLTSAKHATDYATWMQNGRRLPGPMPFHETARCAELVLARLFPSGF